MSGALMIKGTPRTDPRCILMQTRAGCLALFFWVQASVIGKASPLPSSLCGEHWEPCGDGTDEEEVSHKAGEGSLSYADRHVVKCESSTKSEYSDVN